MTFDWNYKEREHKKVVLCDIEKCRGMKPQDFWHYFMGMGLCEWENFFCKKLVESIENAFEKGEQAADITFLFSCDLIGEDEFGEFTKYQESIKNFLMEKVFEVVGESAEEMVVAFQVKNK